MLEWPTLDTDEFLLSLARGVREFLFTSSTTFRESRRTWDRVIGKTGHMDWTHSRLICYRILCVILSEWLLQPGGSMIKSKLLRRRDEVLLIYCYQFYYLIYEINVIKLARSTGFWRIKKIPYQATPTQLGPQKCKFWKNAFLGPNYWC